MSASREKKSRQERAVSGYVDPKAQKERKEAAKQRRTSAVYAAVIAVVLLFAAAMLVWNSNVIQRSAKAFEVNGESFTAADLAYFYYNDYNNFMNSGYGSYFIDTSKPLKDQDSIYGDGSWHDYFLDQAKADVTSYAVLAQKGMAAGFETDEDDEAAASALESLRTYAAGNGYSPARYLKALYGPLMTQGAFERGVRLVAYAGAYLDSLTYSDAELEAAYAEEPERYSSVDIEYVIYLTDTLWDGEEEPTEEEQAALLEQTKLNARTTLARYADGESLEAVAEDLGGSYTHRAYASYSASDMLEWAFDDTRTAGETTTLPYDTDSGCCVVLFHSKSRNDYHSVSVRHILVDDEATANDLLAQWKAGEASEDSFAALAAENTLDSNASSGGLYADVYRGQMVDAFDAWCFDAARRPGDAGIVETSFGYHVMYFVGTNPLPYWQVEASGVLRSADLDEWTESAAAAELSGMRYVG